MKKITIPVEYGYPTVTVMINHHQYVLKTGVEIDVEDCVAAMFEDNESNELEPAPKPDSPGSSGGGGADLLDENGILKQEYLPEGFPYKSGEDVVIMPSTTLTADPESGAFAITEVVNASELFDDMRCVVTLEGIGAYETICREFPPENEMGLQFALGNLAYLGLGDDTGEPFCVALMAPEKAAEMGFAGVMSAPLLAAESLTVSISDFRGTFATMDSGYLPAGCATVVVKVRADFTSKGYKFEETTHTNAQILHSLSSGKNVILELRESKYDTSADIYRVVGWSTSGATFSNVYSYVASSGNTCCMVDTIETSENLSDWTNTEARFVVNTVVAE